jgi:hypothetical protein
MKQRDTSKHIQAFASLTREKMTKSEWEKIYMDAIPNTEVVND